MKPVNHIKSLTEKSEFKSVALLLTIGLALFDMGSDIALAVDYFVAGDVAWGSMTAGFIFSL